MPPKKASDHGKRRAVDQLSDEEVAQRRRTQAQSAYSQTTTAGPSQTSSSGGYGGSPGVHPSVSHNPYTQTMAGGSNQPGPSGGYGGYSDSPPPYTAGPSSSYAQPTTSGPSQTIPSGGYGRGGSNASPAYMFPPFEPFPHAGPSGRGIGGPSTGGEGRVRSSPQAYAAHPATSQSSITGQTPAPTASRIPPGQSAIDAYGNPRPPSGMGASMDLIGFVRERSNPQPHPGAAAYPPTASTSGEPSTSSTGATSGPVAGGSETSSARNYSGEGSALAYRQKYAASGSTPRRRREG